MSCTPFYPMVLLIIIPIKWLQLGIYPIFRQTHIYIYTYETAEGIGKNGVRPRKGEDQPRKQGSVRQELRDAEIYNLLK